jgi:serine/threonine protein kinase
MFGPYEIVREIASGGTAVVYQALQKSLNRPVALKVLHKHLAADPTFLSRFEQEAKIAASLQHPNIVSVFEYGVQQERHFIAMEYVDGFSLELISDKIGALPAEAGAAICIKVCDALDYAHANSVIHRDVKPGNVLVTKEGAVKVADFGFSRLLASANIRLTMANRVVGTPQYMSPEQIEGNNVSYTTDVFSLGIVLYLLVTGMEPFGGDGAMTVMHNILECNYAKPRKINRRVPAKLEAIIVQCLQKNRNQRFGSMAELKDALTAFLSKARIVSPEKETGLFIRSFIDKNQSI